MACTSETQKLLEVLAATLRSLSDEDSARLAELIQRKDWAPHHHRSPSQ